MHVELVSEVAVFSICPRLGPAGRAASRVAAAGRGVGVLSPGPQHTISVDIKSSGIATGRELVALACESSSGSSSC